MPLPDDEVPAYADSRRQPLVDQVDGDLIVAAVKITPDIPAEKQRICPQCNKTAWGQSRWCWNCKFDFERACMGAHPVKSLMISVGFNLLLAAFLAGAILRAHC